MAERQLTVKGTICTDFTAAHKTLTFRHTITRLLPRTPAWMSVVNDRGPFIGARELGFQSYGAAQAVGLVGPGVANVEVTYI